MTTIANKQRSAQSHLGVLPNGWNLISVKSITSKIGSGATPRGGNTVYLQQRVSHALIRSQNVHDRHFDDENLAFISEEHALQLKNTSVRNGDVLLNITGDGVTFGRACIVPQQILPACVNQHVSILRVDPTYADPGFLLTFLTHPQTKVYMETFNTGGSRRAITKGHIESFEIPLPPLPTQRKIAGILSAYDDLIENNLRRIKILEEMAQSLYREWFVNFRFPGHETSTFVDSPLGQIPKGWEVKKLGQLSDQMRRSVPKGELDGTVRYVGLEHIPRQSLAIDAWEVTAELGSNKLSFKRGEILFGKIRPYFHKVSVAPFDGVCSADTIVIRPNKPEYQSLVTACVFTEAFVAHATATSSGSKMPRTDWKVLKDYLHVLPPKKLLASFSTLFENAIAQQQNLITKNQNLRRTRDLLLPKLLSGDSKLESKEFSP